MKKRRKQFLSGEEPDSPRDPPETYDWTCLPLKMQLGQGTQYFGLSVAPKKPKAPKASNAKARTSNKAKSRDRV